MDSNILVSVVMITYGHEKYIKQSIESILSQKCTFQLELIIANDNSPDNTDEIIQNIIHDYRGNYKLNYTMHDSNKGMMQNFIWALEEASGKYIALCEGDDYWTDQYKLQKQVEFLENNVQCNACYTNAIILNEIENTEQKYLNGLKEGYVPLKRSIYRGGASYPTASIVFRREDYILKAFKVITELAGDNLLIMVLSMNGNVYFIDEVTCTYRVWAGGVYSAIAGDMQKIINNKKKTVVGLNKLAKKSIQPFQNLLKERISSESLFILKNDISIKNYIYFNNLSLKDIIRFFFMK